MTMSEPFEGVSREELIDLERRLDDQLAAFSTVITKVPYNDTRDPPGDLHGTGWLIEIEHQKFVLKDVILAPIMQMAWVPMPRVAARSP